MTTDVGYCKLLCLRSSIFDWRHSRVVYFLFYIAASYNYLNLLLFSPFRNVRPFVEFLTSPRLIELHEVHVVERLLYPSSSLAASSSPYVIFSSISC